MQNENEKPYTEVQKGVNHVLKINGFCIAKFCFPRVQIKDHNNVSGNNRENWTYFDQLDAILGTRPSSAPVTLLQSGSSSAIIQSQEIDCKLYAFLSMSLTHEYIIHYVQLMKHNYHQILMRPTLRGTLKMKVWCGVKIFIQLNA